MPNRPTPDFDASVPSDFRYSKAVRIANAKRMTNAMMTPPSSVKRESKAVSAVITVCPLRCTGPICDT